MPAGFFGKTGTGKLFFFPLRTPLAPSVPAGPHALRSPGPDADSGASFPSPLSPSDGLCCLYRGPSLGAMGGRLPPATGARFFNSWQTELLPPPNTPCHSSRGLLARHMRATVTYGFVLSFLLFTRYRGFLTKPTVMGGLVWCPTNKSKRRQADVGCVVATLLLLAHWLYFTLC